MIHKLLKLQPHRHSGKLLHHRHTSYHGLLLLLLLTGGLIALTGGLARAADDTIVVTALVPAPLPTGAPTITSPTDGITSSVPDITVAGDCPVSDPAVLVYVTDDTVTVGSVVCSSSGSYALPVQLATGSNQLRATVINRTGQVGASSNVVTVTYRPPAAPATNQSIPARAGTPPSAALSPAAGTPLSVTVDTPFLVFGLAKSAAWAVSVDGASGPYAITIDWGDGSVDHLTLQQAGTQLLNHRYGKLGVYQVRLAVRAADGSSVVGYYAALSPVAVFGGSGSTSGPGSWDFRLTPYVYAAYFVTLLSVLVLWRIEHLYHLRRLQPVRVYARRSPAKGRRR